MKKRNNISVLEKLEASKLRGGEKIKARMITVLVLVAVISMIATTASAYPAEPSYPASNYIETIYPWDNDGGVSLLLTPYGWVQGTYWIGAWTIAGYTISEYERLEGQGSWPYNKRSQWSIAAEIMFHCVVIDPTQETIDMGFSEWWWD